MVLREWNLTRTSGRGLIRRPLRLLLLFYLQVIRAAEKQIIYYQDSALQQVESGTQFTGRISVNGTGATRQSVLTINNVQLEDEVEFICLVRSLTEGTGEGRTNLKVFGKTSLPQTVVSSL